MPSSALFVFMQYVVKRDGRQEPVHFDKITARITKLSYGLNPDFCDPVSRGAVVTVPITWDLCQFVYDEGLAL